MVDRRALEPDEIQEALGDLAGWTVVDDKLHRRFTFADFVEAFAFMTGVALIAEKLDHHPEWSNVYGTVTVDLVTHDLSAISTWDTHLAQKMNELAGKRGAGG